jgi:phospholipid/cholesterol/gamma-HCH transport system substrate-binding protein
MRRTAPRAAGRPARWPVRWPASVRGRLAAIPEAGLGGVLSVGPASPFRSRRERRIFTSAVAVLTVLVVAGGWLVYAAGHQGKQVTAYFTETIGVYPGSDVRILGVAVGTVDSVQPAGGQVRVVMTVDHGIALPARADAVVVSPSVVADRYVQLTPAYTGGPQLASGAVIPASRTATPVEVDQLYASLDKLATALGPNGANAHGALSNVLKTGAANLAGNGKALGDTITQFGQAMGTLGGSADNLSATINHLQLFTTMLKDNNGQVVLAEQQLAQVSGFLAADRQDLGTALDELATALRQVQRFVGSNRALIKSNVTKLAGITQLLVTERASLAEALDDAPLAVDNLLAAYDPLHRTLDGRADLNELSMSTAAAAGAGSQAAGTSAAVLIEVPASQVGGLPPLPLPAVGPVYGTPSSTGSGGR